MDAAAGSRRFIIPRHWADGGLCSAAVIGCGFAHRPGARECRAANFPGRTNVYWRRDAALTRRR
jgi:hypothetical protein